MHQRRRDADSGTVSTALGAKSGSLCAGFAGTPVLGAVIVALGVKIGSLCIDGAGTPIPVQLQYRFTRIMGRFAPTVPGRRSGRSDSTGASSELPRKARPIHNLLWPTAYLIR